MNKMKHGMPKPVLTLVNGIINKTPDGDIGFEEAIDAVSSGWSQFEAAGAIVGDLEAITRHVRWAKFEGFCETAPI